MVKYVYIRCKFAVGSKLILVASYFYWNKRWHVWLRQHCDTYTIATVHFNMPNNERLDKLYAEKVEIVG